MQLIYNSNRTIIKLLHLTLQSHKKSRSTFRISLNYFLLFSLPYFVSLFYALIFNSYSILFFLHFCEQWNDWSEWSEDCDWTEEWKKILRRILYHQRERIFFNVRRKVDCPWELLMTMILNVVRMLHQKFFFTFCWMIKLFKQA